jgi:CheY-like chemotaxis protein
MLEIYQGEGTHERAPRCADMPSRVPIKASQSLGVILLVEDEWLVRGEIAEALRGAGWEVLEAGSGERAVALLQSGQHIDVIVTDIQLAGALSGWDVAEQGRELQAAMPVIYAPGNAADRSRRVHNSMQPSAQQITSAGLSVSLAR